MSASPPPPSHLPSGNCGVWVREEEEVRGIRGEKPVLEQSTVRSCKSKKGYCNRVQVDYVSYSKNRGQNIKRKRAVIPTLGMEAESVKWNEMNQCGNIMLY